jgi:hypothetical protein
MKKPSPFNPVEKSSSFNPVEKAVRPFICVDHPSALTRAALGELDY